MAHDQVVRLRFLTVRSDFKFKVLGRYEARLSGNEPHVTLSVLAGQDGHLVYCGTLTMSESEWGSLKGQLGSALGEHFLVEGDDL